MTEGVVSDADAGLGLVILVQVPWRTDKYNARAFSHRGGITL